MTSEGIIKLIRQYAAEGKTRYEIAAAIGKPYNYTSQLARQHDIKTRRKRRMLKPSIASGTLRRPEIDTLLTGEYSLEQIAERVKPLIYFNRGRPERLTRQRIKQYIDSTGQHDAFIANRKVLRENGEAGRDCSSTALIVTLKQYLKKRLEKERLAVRTSVGYDQRRRAPRNIPVEKIVRLLDNYWKAMESSNATLNKVAQESGFTLPDTSYLVRRLGLTAFHNHKPHVVTPRRKKEAIKRAYCTDMPLSDIAYFLGVPRSVVLQNMRTYFGNTGNRYVISYSGYHAAGTGSPLLPYRMASEVYELHDAGFGEDEISKYFDRKRRAVAYALANRPAIERKIVGMLDLLYPETKHEKPYI